MGTIRVCDRCGEALALIERDDPIFRLMLSLRSGTDATFDDEMELCDDCADVAVHIRKTRILTAKSTVEGYQPQKKRGKTAKAKAAPKTVKTD